MPPTRHLDALDKRILRILQENGRASNSSIARHLGVTEGTIRNRIGRMIREGLTKVVGIADPTKLGFVVDALIHLQVDVGKIRDVANKLMKMKEVFYLTFLLGRYDIMIEVVFMSNQDLFDFVTKKLGAIDGIVRAETSIIPVIGKRNYDWGVPGDVGEGEQRERRAPRTPRRRRPGPRTRSRMLVASDLSGTNATS